MNKCIVVVECAIESDDKYLIIKRPAGTHAEGLLAFPGGKVEEQDIQGDVLINAVKREVWEEVGINLEDPIHYVTSSCFMDRFGNPVIDAIFHCRLEKSSATVTASEREVPAYYWMTKDEIMAADNSPEWLKHYLNQIKI
jgi:8-oxo-dGTP diphosphatase